MVSKTMEPSPRTYFTKQSKFDVCPWSTHPQKHGSHFRTS
jgi:hypothetical protein